MSAEVILAIDPGPAESAWVLWDGAQIHGFGKEPNIGVLSYIKASATSLTTIDRCVIEQIASYGMSVGAEVFETCVWTGRFMEAFGSCRVDRIPRINIKVHLCNSPRANDSNVRQALIDRFGGKDKAIGRKANPGPLYGMSGDVWQALAVGLTWWDMNSTPARKALYAQRKRA